MESVFVMESVPVQIYLCFKFGHKKAEWTSKGEVSKTSLYRGTGYISTIVPFISGYPFLDGRGTSMLAIWSLQELDRCGWQYHFLHRSPTSEPIITNPNCEGNGWKATVIGCDEQCFVVYNGIASMFFPVLSLLKWGSLVGLSAIHCQCWHSKGFYVW